MALIDVDHKPSEKKLKELEVSTWPVWAKDPSEYTKEYDMPERFYVIEGEAQLTPDNESSISVSPGCLVTINAPHKCHWQISKTMRLRYLLG